MAAAGQNIGSAKILIQPNIDSALTVRYQKKELRNGRGINDGQDCFLAWLGARVFGGRSRIG
ncbi:hypothetical protein [Mesorhizobium sp. M1027]|uniref:hypothetical protein n=1 Tax=Mesorhizobium sp. M1027 TaxID=2957050 RepID=UPI00333B29BF